MVDDKELEELQERVSRVIEEGEKLVAEAEERIRSMDKLYKELNLSPDDCRNFIQGNKFTPDQKEKIQRELERFREEIEQDKLAAIEVVKAQTRKGPRIPVNKIGV